MILNVTREKSDIHGWGLFADVFICSNTMIEKCTYISINEAEYNPRILNRYSFINPKGKGVVYPIGYACLLNSAFPANCRVDTDDNFLIITAIKDIEAGEELTLQY